MAFAPVMCMPARLNRVLLRLLPEYDGNPLERFSSDHGRKNSRRVEQDSIAGRATLAEPLRLDWRSSRVFRCEPDLQLVGPNYAADQQVVS
jgi:hypothetical protein